MQWGQRSTTEHREVQGHVSRQRDTADWDLQTVLKLCWTGLMSNFELPCLSVSCSKESPVSLEKLSLSDPPKASEQQPAEDSPVPTQTDRK